MARKIGDSTIVITGASSGIGRATALALAKENAALVLAARRREPLEQLARDCESLGGLALAVRTDVTDEDGVATLARKAIETFGRIDAWVNNAGVYVIGEFEKVPLDVWRRVLDTNVLGAVNGCRAALPYMREQGAGVIVNVASMLATMGIPYGAPYVASKYAVRGLSECLREELIGTSLDVVTILPATIDTPLWDHAANFTGRAFRPLDPVYDPQLVADAIVEAIASPAREVFVPARGVALPVLHAVGGRLFERAVRRSVDRGQFEDRAAEETAGNLFRPIERGSGVTGGWRLRERPSRKVGLLAALAAVAVPAVAALAYSRRRELAALVA